MGGKSRMCMPSSLSCEASAGRSAGRSNGEGFLRLVSLDAGFKKGSDLFDDVRQEHSLVLSLYRSILWCFFMVYIQRSCGLIDVAT